MDKHNQENWGNWNERFSLQDSTQTFTFVWPILEKVCFLAGENWIELFEWGVPHPFCWKACSLLCSLIFCWTKGFNPSNSFKELISFYSNKLKIRSQPKVCMNNINFERRYPTNHLSQSNFLALWRCLIISMTWYCLRHQTRTKKRKTT